MAKEQQRQQRTRLNNPYEKMKQDNENRMADSLLESKKSQLEEAVANLARRAIASEKKYGKDNFNTRILNRFYTISYSLQNVVELMFSMKEAMGVLTQTMNIMDDTFHYIDNMMNVENYGQYTLLARIKTKMKMRKFIRMNRNRMKSILNMVSGYTEVADAMFAAMGSFDKKLKKSMEKKFGKKDNVMADYQNQAEKELQKYRDEYDKTHSTDTSASSADSSGNSSNPGNIDDITFM